MPHRRADTVGSGVAATDYDHVLVFSGNEVTVPMLRVKQALGIGAEKFHRHINALELVSGDRQIAWLGRACTNHHRIKIIFQFCRRQIHADVGIGDELDALRRHHIDASLHKRLFELRRR